VSRGKSRREEYEEFARPPLPRGRHRLTPEEVNEDQRRRLIAAMAESVAARGYAATSVDRVIEGAGVSRGTFYQHFANRSECLLAAHIAGFNHLVELISVACETEEEWPDKVLVGIVAAIDFASRSPDETRLLVLDAIAADARAARQGLAASERLAAMLRAGRAHYPQAADLPELVEAALVGAAFSAVSLRLLNGESPTGLEPQLVYLMLVPYLGAKEAMRMAAKAERLLAARDGD